MSTQQIPTETPDFFPAEWEDDQKYWLKIVVMVKFIFDKTWMPDRAIPKSEAVEIQNLWKNAKRNETVRISFSDRTLEAKKRNILSVEIWPA